MARINGLAKGQVCTYRVETECDGIVFKPTKTSGMNVTWVEFEDDSVEFIKSSDKNNNGMPHRETKFIYYYYTPNELYNFFNHEDIFPDYRIMAKTPRKGQYDFIQSGWKAFNNPFQLASGTNPNLEIFDEMACKRRSVYVSVTALDESVSTEIMFE